tara:strand:+ start:129 stop:308 length:180 start_codon:yes stop_codon:yes gene_type:complete
MAVQHCCNNNTTELQTRLNLGFTIAAGGADYAFSKAQMAESTLTARLCFFQKLPAPPAS